MNKWKAIPVAKAVRVVMKFQGAIALGVVLAAATPELLHRGAEPHTQQETQKDVDTPIGRAAIEAVVSVVDSQPPVMVDWSSIRKPRKDVRYYS